jgi:hypothetical protein
MPWSTSRDRRFDRMLRAMPSCEKFLEMRDAVERGAQDHERPALAHHLQRDEEAALGNIDQRLLQFFHHGPS